MPGFAKSTPYLSCHRDLISAKVPGSVAGWLRQVPQPTFIAGPLYLSHLQLTETTNFEKRPKYNGTIPGLIYIIIHGLIYII
jgi:hypothetical protein